MKKFIIPLIFCAPLILAAPVFAAPNPALYNPESRSATVSELSTAPKAGTSYAYWHYRHWNHRYYHRGWNRNHWNRWGGHYRW